MSPPATNAVVIVRDCIGLDEQIELKFDGAEKSQPYLSILSPALNVFHPPSRRRTSDDVEAERERERGGRGALEGGFELLYHHPLESAGI